MTFFNYKILSPKLISGETYDLKHIEVRGFVFKELRTISATNLQMWDTNAIIEYYGKSEVIRLRKKDDTLADITILNKDDLFILMYFVNIITSPDYKLGYGVKCPDCGKKISFDVTIDSIQFEDTKIPSEVPLYFDNFKANLKRLNLKGLQTIDIFMADKNNEDIIKEYDKSDIVVAMMLNPDEISDNLKEYLDGLNIQGEYSNIKQNLKILDTLNLKDIERLSLTLKEMEPKLKPFPVKCKCGFSSHTTIDIELKDILPTDGLELLNEFRNISQ